MPKESSFTPQGFVFNIFRYGTENRKGSGIGGGRSIDMVMQDLEKDFLIGLPKPLVETLHLRGQTYYPITITRGGKPQIPFFIGTPESLDNNGASASNLVASVLQRHAIATIAVVPSDEINEVHEFGAEIRKRASFVGIAGVVDNRILEVAYESEALSKISVTLLEKESTYLTETIARIIDCDKKTASRILQNYTVKQPSCLYIPNTTTLTTAAMASKIKPEKSQKIIYTANALVVQMINKGIFIGNQESPEIEKDSFGFLLGKILANYDEATLSLDLGSDEFQLAIPQKLDKVNPTTI